MTGPATHERSLAGRLTALGDHWRILALAGLVGAIVGVAAALALPSWYTAGGSFQPESQAPSFTGGLAGLATQLTGGGFNQTNPQFYADLIQSDVVTRRLAAASFPTGATLRSLPEIYGLESLSGEKRVQLTAMRLRRSLSSGVNIRTGVVSFSVEGRSPEMAKSLADSVLAIVNDFNVNIRRSRAGYERAFTTTRAAEARRALEAAENALASFDVRNRVAASPYLRTQQERLRRAAEVASQVYLQLRLQAEQAAVQEVRNTPALTVIEAPQLPIRRSRPRRRVVVVLSVFAAITASAAWLLFREPSTRVDTPRATPER